MLLTLALAALPVAQLDDAQRRKPLIPPPAERQDADAEGSATQPGDAARRAPAATSPAAGDEAGPRALGDAPLPFETRRTLVRVNGEEVTSAELNELVRYYRSFRPGSDDLLLRDAFAALLPAKAVRARYGDELPAMQERIEEAAAALNAGADFAEVVAEYSDDGEAPTPDGSYVFGREVAVQPFDRLAHTPPMNALKGPFLTKYGFHLLEVTAYARDAQDPGEDRTTVRHVLVMYPSLRVLDEGGEDVRAHIAALVDEARIALLEPGLDALVPPERRGQIVARVPLPSPAPEDADADDADGKGE